MDGGASPEVRGLGIDLADLHTFAHLAPAAIERVARRWLSPAERAWCAGQHSFRLAVVTVLSCKESVCKATGGATLVTGVMLTMEGVLPRGGASASGPYPVALRWEVRSGHILTVGVLGQTDQVEPLLGRIVCGWGASDYPDAPVRHPRGLDHAGEK